MDVSTERQQAVCFSSGNSDVKYKSHWTAMHGCHITKCFNELSHAKSANGDDYVANSALRILPNNVTLLPCICPSLHGNN